MNSEELRTSLSSSHYLQQVIKVATALCLRLSERQLLLTAYLSEFRQDLGLRTETNQDLEPLFETERDSELQFGLKQRLKLP